MRRKREEPVKQADDGTYGSYAPYAGYDPYSAAAETEAAKMQDGRFSQTFAQVITQRQI